jgi:hypothetical protein
LCHTGLVWKADLGGTTHRFRLTGINNQNFLMEDAKTGSWWQQVTGEAVQGPLTGAHLESMPWEEVTFAVWKREHPNTKVLLPDEDAAGEYAPANWEEEVATYPVPTTADSSALVKPRDLVIGIRVGSDARAYRCSDLVAQSSILDTVGETPIFLTLHPDGNSIRCFDRRVEGRALELVREPSTFPPMYVDRETGSRWDFTGSAVEGPLAGRALHRVPFLKEYWFDWKAYNPRTSVFAG